MMDDSTLGAVTVLTRCSKDMRPVAVSYDGDGMITAIRVRVFATGRVLREITWRRVAYCGARGWAARDAGEAVHRIFRAYYRHYDMNHVCASGQALIDGGSGVPGFWTFEPARPGGPALAELKLRGD